jgi:hypothetical protein
MIFDRQINGGFTIMSIASGLPTIRPGRDWRRLVQCGCSASPRPGNRQGGEGEIAARSQDWIELTWPDRK